MIVCVGAVMLGQEEDKLWESGDRLWDGGLSGSRFKVGMGSREIDWGGGLAGEVREKTLIKS